MGLGGSNDPAELQKQKQILAKYRAGYGSTTVLGFVAATKKEGRRFCLEERNGESEICEVKVSVKVSVSY